MNTKPRIYLAGPMAGLTIDEANKWRQYLANSYGGLFEFVNPCRDKEELRKHGAMTQFGYDDAFMCGNHAVFSRDTHDVLSCDGVLINFLGARQVSVGTIFEMGLAWGSRKPIVSVLEEGNPYDHIFTREASVECVSSVERGIQVVRSLFNRL